MSDRRLGECSHVLALLLVTNILQAPYDSVPELPQAASTAFAIFWQVMMGQALPARDSRLKQVQQMDKTSSVHATKTTRLANLVP